MKTISPLALYIHFPWCVRKCPYCDFNSHALRGEVPEETYIEALLADLEIDQQRVADRTLTSIFMGGGTPSLFSEKSIEKLLMEIHQRFTVVKDIEITLEANPGTIDYQRFVGYRAAGVNRLSIGVQSFQKEKLIALGRIHDDGEAIRAIQAAKAAGFTNFNIDLMFGLPNQSMADALFDLQTAIDLSPSHLSWYQLTIEPNTFFAHKPPILPEDERIWEMQEQGYELLAKNNFVQYEISAYCHDHNYCRHNKNYWEFGDYLGIGAGAHGKITDKKTGNITRMWKVKNPKDYLSSLDKKDIVSFIGGDEIIKKEQLPFEFMLNALRLYQNIPVKLFEDQTGLPLGSIVPFLQKAKEKDLLVWDQQSIQPTELGRRFYNDLVELFIEK